MDLSYLSLSGKKALITGGSRGIGKSIAMILAGAGADVAISGRAQETLDAAAEEIGKLGTRVLPVAAHSRKMEELKHLFETVKKEFGRIDFLINNAAANPAIGMLVDMDEKIYDVIMSTNLKSYTYLNQLAGRLMIGQGGGNILNITSVAGLSPQKGLGLYSISKAGIVMLTKVLALELGEYNIRVNAIAPGVVKTKFSEALWSNEDLMTESLPAMLQRQILTPDEVARTALYLLSDASAHITGQTIMIGGVETL